MMVMMTVVVMPAMAMIVGGVVIVTLSVRLAQLAAPG
jgi:hypothetical protein